ncbi:MAG: (2Fe-2S)-binding protein [Gammaproteobacteria bacterium]|nr:(2Fe-2S)-binding protein [Gammaproteobacteria bacterium]MCY4209929.1 (2Fe-2S)-binding protein [Gammaproteobacteria bacterium]MCY4281460.1 (2Fe-2S)-binding protein [Gammaproteobacteria bacterium]MCY4338667.1 (2Fe-2S)-binding protein [Gammaproteobacteria bacterium]
MYVCTCNAVTEREVRQAITEGARTNAQLRQRLDAKRVCGSCDDCLEEYLAEASEEQYEIPTPFVFPAPCLTNGAG